MTSIDAPTSLVAENRPAADSSFEDLREKSLKASGYAYLVGDAALFASGALSGRYKEASAAGLWAIGGLACAKYANPNAEQQCKLLSAKLSRFLHKKGIEIPADVQPGFFNQHRDTLDRVENFLYSNPSMVLHATYAVGGLQMIRSGLAHQRKWDTASGALVAAGALAGLLIPEKKPDPDHPPEGLIGKAVSWVQERPLRISGGLYMLNNASLLMSAFAERKSNPASSSYMFKFLTAASYIFGNTMLALSSKHHSGASDDSILAMQKLADAAGHVIAAQAPQVQEPLVQQISEYLAAQPDVSFSAQQIGDLLHQKLAQHSKQRPAASPAPEGWQARVQAPPAPEQGTVL